MKLLCRQPPCPSGSSVLSVSVLARSRAWSSTLARSRANPSHSKDILSISTLPRNRTSSDSFENCYALPAHPAGPAIKMSRPGLGPGSRPSEGRMRSLAPSRRFPQSQSVPGLGSNQDQGLRSALCDPLHHRDNHSIRADDWTCTSIVRFTKPLPRCSATSATQAGARGVEPRTAALETACSPRSTPL